MIQSAMMFALGIFVSGLVWLAFSVALVRRARRLTERRLLSGVATRRVEFDAERDELRARHAVQMHRLEREVSRVLDMATAHRLEADLRERDLISARAELEAHREDFAETEARLIAERETIQDLERRHAEAGSAMRAAQHQLKLETTRRAAAEEALDEASILADQRRIALVALRAENNTLRERLGEEPGTPLPFELDSPKLPRAVAAAEGTDEAAAAEPAVAAAEESAEALPAPMGGSVVQLPTRPRPPAPETPDQSPDQSVAAVAEATRDLKRIAGEAQEGAAEGSDETAEPAADQPTMPAAPGVTNIGAFVAMRRAPQAAEAPAADAQDEEPKPEGEVSEKAESQFFEALAEIRALKRAANQAGE